MANASEKVLLVDTFCMSANKYSVILTASILQYTKVSTGNSRGKVKVVQISDIIGCNAKSVSSTVCPKGQSIGPSQGNGGKCATITIFAYPFQKVLFGGNRSRHRESITFEICSASEEENERTALHWKNVINCLARGLQVKPSDVENCVPPPWGRFLILINPQSGTGKAMKIFHTQVAPMLEEADIPHKIFVTEYAGHASELMQNMDLSEWAAVVVVAGDGVIYEVINGLMQRVDWSSAIKTAVGCVPGGSGNALACSINYSAGEPVTVNPVLHSTFVLIKHRRIPMDLVLVQTPSKQFYSFLSVTWGLIADVDLESEKYRFVGEARFTFGAFKTIVNVPDYSGKLSFLPVAKYIPKQNKTSAKIRKSESFSGRRSSNAMSSARLPKRAFTTTDDQLCDKLFTDNDTEHVRSTSEQAVGDGDTANLSANKKQSSARITHSSDVPDSGEDDTKNNESLAISATVENTASALNDSTLCVTHASGSDRSALNSDVVNGRGGCLSVDDETTQNNQASFMNVTKQNEEETENVDDTRNESRESSSVPCPLLPPLGQPVGEDWVEITGKFVMVLALNQTHIGSDLLMAPFSRQSDGVIHLVIVRGGITRYRLLQVLLSFSKGGHVDLPDVESVPVLAFRLEPGEDSKVIMIDGERLDPVPLQAQVLPGMARVLAIQ